MTTKRKTTSPKQRAQQRYAMRKGAFISSIRKVELEAVRCWSSKCQGVLAELKENVLKNMQRQYDNEIWCYDNPDEIPF